MYSKAIVRKPGRNFAEGITSSGLGKPDFEKALLQHDAYCEALVRCGLELIIMEADERYPDGCFVEDTAIVTSEVAVITRPGAISRRGEENEIAKIISGFRKTERIVSPGTVDGGDVLRAEGHFYIGISGRTNREGARQLASILAGYGFSSSEVNVGSGLHLKSGIAYLSKGNFICTESLSGIKGINNFIITDENENYPANSLLLNDFLLFPNGFPATESKIRKLGYNVVGLDMSEFRKMDGGLTCLSLLI